MDSFNDKMRGELLEPEVLYALLEVQLLAEQYRQTYNRFRPHSCLGYQAPAPEVSCPRIRSRCLWHQPGRWYKLWGQIMALFLGKYE